jgi:hypothetical protein
MIGEWSSGCPRETCDASYILEKMGEIGAKFGVAAEPDATAGTSAASRRELPPVQRVRAARRNK